MINAEQQSTTLGQADMRACVERCTECHAVCLETYNYSLTRGGDYGEPLHLRLLLDCAVLCQTTADLILRGSDLYRQLCQVCALACESCAQSCDRFAVPAIGSGAPMSRHSGPEPVQPERADPQMKRCSESCRRCAEECRQMAGESVTKAS